VGSVASNKVQEVVNGGMVNENLVSIPERQQLMPSNASFPPVPSTAYQETNNNNGSLSSLSGRGMCCMISMPVVFHV